MPADPPSVPWAALRRAPRADEHLLAPATRAWLRRLPPRRRPLQLCERFARVANRIAWCWEDDELVAQVFDDLLVDRRGGRRGFPGPLLRELQRLRDYRCAPNAGASCQRSLMPSMRTTGISASASSDKPSRQPTLTPNMRPIGVSLPTP